MMSEETVKFEGRLALNRQERMKLNLKIQGLVKSLRDLLDPTKPAEKLETELIAQHALDLGETRIKYQELLRQAEVIRDALGK